MGFYSSLCSAHLGQELIGSAVNEREDNMVEERLLICENPGDPRLALSNKI